MKFKVLLARGNYGNNNLKSNQWMVGMFLKTKKLEFDSLLVFGTLTE